MFLYLQYGNGYLYSYIQIYEYNLRKSSSLLLNSAVLWGISVSRQNSLLFRHPTDKAGDLEQSAFPPSPDKIWYSLAWHSADQKQFLDADKSARGDSIAVYPAWNSIPLNCDRFIAGALGLIYDRHHLLAESVKEFQDYVHIYG